MSRDAAAERHRHGVPLHYLHLHKAAAGRSCGLQRTIPEGTCVPPPPPSFVSVSSSSLFSLVNWLAVSRQRVTDASACLHVCIYFAWLFSICLSNACMHAHTEAFLRARTLPPVLITKAVHTLPLWNSPAETPAPPSHRRGPCCFHGNSRGGGSLFLSIPFFYILSVSLHSLIASDRTTVVATPSLCSPADDFRHLESPPFCPLVLI